MKAVLLQGLIASVFGNEVPQMRAVLEMVATEESRLDGATVLGQNTKATRIGAAYANTELMYVAGLYDYFQGLTHPGPILIAAALANAELERKPMSDVIAALAAGYEVSCRLADGFVHSAFAQGFRPASIFPTIGAAVVSARLMDLDEDHTLAAIALAANSAAGLAEAARSGGADSAIHLPHATRSGVFAATMARARDVRASEQIFEGAAGFYSAYTGSSEGRLRYSPDGRTQIPLTSIVDALGSTYRLLDVSFHMYPLHGASQPVIDLMREMREQHAIDPLDIDQVEVRVSYLETVYPSPAFPRSRPNTTGPGTIPYYLAHAAVHGGYPQVGARLFSREQSLDHDEQVLEFANTRVSLVGEFARAQFSPRVVVRMKDGRVLDAEYPYRRMTWNFDELVARLEETVVGYPLGRDSFEKLVSTVRSAERLDSVAPLLALVSR